MFIILTAWILSLNRALIAGAISLLINYSLIHLAGGFKLWENWIPLRLYFIVIVFVSIIIIGWLSDLRIELSIKNQQLQASENLLNAKNEELSNIAHLMEFYFNHVQNEEKLLNYESFQRHKNGNLVIVESNAVPKYNNLGELIGFVGVDRDITDKHLAQEKLKESEDKYRRLVDNLPVGVFKLNYEGIIQFVHLVDLPEPLIENRELIGANIFDLISPEYRTEFGLMFNKAVQEGFQTKVKVLSFFDNWLAFTIIPVKDEVMEVLAIYEVINEPKRIQEAT